MTSAWNKEAFFSYLVTLELKSELERKLDTKKGWGNEVTTDAKICLKFTYSSHFIVSSKKPNFFISLNFKYFS